MHRDLLGRYYVLTVSEFVTGYCWARPLISKRPEKVSEKLDEIFLENNLNPTIRTDNGGEFKGDLDLRRHVMGCEVNRIRSRNSRSNVSYVHEL